MTLSSLPLRFVSLTVTLGALTGCGSDPSTIASQDDAEAVITATFNEFSEGMDAGTAAIEFETACTDGGTLFYSTDIQSTLPLKATITVDYRDCMRDDLSLNGELAYKMSENGDTTQIDVKGDLDMTGAVTGLCRFALSTKLQDEQVGVAGTLCGYSAEDFATATIP